MENKRIVAVGAGVFAVLSLCGLAAPLSLAAAESAPVNQSGQSVNEQRPPNWSHGVDLMLRNETAKSFDVYYAVDDNTNWKFGATLAPGQTFTHGDCHSGPYNPDVAFRIYVDGKVKAQIFGNNPSIGSPFIRWFGKSEYADRSLQIDCGLDVGEWYSPWDVNYDKPSEKTILATVHRDSDNKDGWKQMQCYVKHVPTKDLY